MNKLQKVENNMNIGKSPKDEFMLLSKKERTEVSLKRKALEKQGIKVSLLDVIYLIRFSWHSN